MTIPAAKRREITQAVLASLQQGIPLTVALEGVRAKRTTFEDWARADPIVKEALRQARELGWDWLAHQCLEIADDTSQDVLYDAEGRPYPNGANVLSRKLRIETRLKLLAKWDVNRYGETKRVQIDGEITQTTRHVVDPALLDDASRAALRQLLDAVEAKGLLPAPIDADFEETTPPL